MNEVFIVKDLEQIKALSSPYRISIIEAFNGEEATAKHISSKIGEPHSKVNYHIKLLAKVGLLKLVKESPKYGVIEKYYQPIAKSFIIDSKVTNNAGEVDKFKSAVFDRINKDFLANARNEDMDLPSKITYDSNIYLTEEEIATVNDKVWAILEPYHEKKAGTKKIKCSVGVVITPLEKE
ncbi:MAG: helix-turn-helix transcriptional regulator [Clostridia bacterium]|nr:helix-turn-helix transcriptional regulator [Clostridia bacterium]